MKKTITLTKEEFIDRCAEIMADLSDKEESFLKLFLGCKSWELPIKTGVVVAVLSDGLFKGEEENDK